MKDTLTERPDKKLTHRVRQKRTKEVKYLLQKPDHEIDHMKLSVMHLMLLQEARERIKSKTIPSGPSSSSNQSSQFGDTNSFDPFGENYDNDRTENHGLENPTKLNYHSYMNKQTRAKWSKSDTDLFYQGLQQFGSDFAMIQQLFPDKTRDQMRQKFKTEEKKHPMRVHDAILHRSRDNLYLKQVIKQLNIEDLPRDINSTHKQEVASIEVDTGNEDLMEEEGDSNWSDKELGTHQSEVREGEHVSGNADDDLDLDVFDWY
ncbi:Transcription factor TFIIIB component B'' [Hordeum vulgare]|uniref:transcription factor TFIIIB component B''-like isoform X2 n=1 Tax=Hordeum vulgare subsp. vulgare TaxID=112509 RepID=UPI000295BE34|nr:transcription factor TFIIIB component B''-like isoform X2 [Hordeum vulgare subsp. vulgare]KAE8814076.1 Transcription factor TFIIIB component B'' [Hordeum vulgare]